MELASPDAEHLQVLLAGIPGVLQVSILIPLCG